MNLGPGGRRLRRLVAAGMTAAAAASILAILLTDAPRAWRLLVFLPLFAGVLAWFQASAGT